MEHQSSSYFCYINETNKGNFAPSDSINRVCVSRLRNIQVPISKGNFAIKYVMTGVEHYRIDNKIFEVPAQSFLITCTKAAGIGIVESKSDVNGICIDINYNTIAEAYTLLSSNGKVDLDNNLCGYFMSPSFFDNVYPIAFSALRPYIQNIAKRLSHNPTPDETELNEDWFFELAEHSIIHENETLRKMQALSGTKTTTKKEVLRRVLAGKYFMEENFRFPLKISEIARIALLSEFHFFRSFKEIFGTTPHSFLLRKRLEAACRQLMHSDTSIADAALANGFADLSSFSKAFRKYFGISPSEVKDATTYALHRHFDLKN